MTSPPGGEWVGKERGTLCALARERKGVQFWEYRKSKREEASEGALSTTRKWSRAGCITGCKAKGWCCGVQLYRDACSYMKLPPSLLCPVQPHIKQILTNIPLRLCALFQPEGNKPRIGCPWTTGRCGVCACNSRPPKVNSTWHQGKNIQQCAMKRVGFGQQSLIRD